MERILRIVAGIAILYMGQVCIGMWSLIGIIPILTDLLMVSTIYTIWWLVPIKSQ